MTHEGIVLDLIERIYAAVEDPRLWAAFLERLAQTVHGTVTAMVSGDLRAGKPDLAAGARLDEVLSRAYEDYLTSGDWGSSKTGAGLEFGRIVTSQMMPPHRDLVEREKYNELLGKLNVQHLLAAIIVGEHHRVSSVSILRSSRRGAFGDSDVLLLEMLMPHLQRALDLHGRLVEDRSERAAALEALDAIPVGILLLDRSGRALVVNRAASEILAQKDGLILGAEGLTASTRDETQSLRHLVMEAAGAAAASGSRSAGVLAVCRASARRAFSVFVKPIGDQESDCHRVRHAVAVFVVDPDRRIRADESVLRYLYGFTPAESRVATVLLQGESVEEAARDLDVSVNTARTHMKHLFEKTDTNRHRELVRLLLCSTCYSRASACPRDLHQSSRSLHHSPSRPSARKDCSPPALS